MLREPDDPGDKIQSIVQQVVAHSTVGELTLSQRELGTQANNKLLFVTAVERLVEKDPVFERLRPWLQQIRFNTLTDLARHAMVVQGDPIASRSLSNDYYLEQYFKA